jgi:NitT/TauT family transport system substrate-binding protein
MTPTRRDALGLTAGMLALAAGVRAAAADDLTPLRIGTLGIDPGMQPLYAQDQGFVKAAGIDATVSVINTSYSVVAAIVAGSLDVGGASVPVVALARQHGIPLRYFAPAGIYTGPIGNTNLMVLQSSPIKTGADLNGKTVAVSTIKDMTQFESSTWIDKSGGDSKSVRFVEVPYVEMQAALEQGRADAVAIIEPYVTTAKSSARLLANLSDTFGGPYLLFGWIATDEWLRRNADVAKRFTAVMLRSAAWANSHPKDSVDEILRYTKIKPEVATAMNRLRYAETSAIDPVLVQRPVDMMVRYGALAPLNARDIVTPL